MSAVTRGGPFVPPGVPPRSPAPQAPNRYTRTRARPVNPPGIVKRPGIAPGGPSMQPTNPAITNPNVRIGVPMQPPSFVTPPPSDSLNAQVITPITNPATGETYMAPNAGYTLNPNITNPNVSIGMPITGRTPQLEAMPYTGLPDNLVSIGGSLVPTPQLEAMPYTGNPAYQPTQATGMNPNVSIGFGKSQPGFMQSTPGMGQANQTGPMSGGFNPSLSNTALPGNF